MAASLPTPSLGLRERGGLGTSEDGLGLDEADGGENEVPEGREQRLHLLTTSEVSEAVTSRPYLEVVDGGTGDLARPQRVEALRHERQEEAPLTKHPATDY